VHSKLGRHGFAREHGVGQAQIVNHSRIIARGKILPNRAAHLRGHIFGIKYIFHAHRRARQNTHFASLTLFIYGTRLTQSVFWV
jgi:hypothetical protein